MQIYITSFFRYDFTLETINKIVERTADHPFDIHVFDNASDFGTMDKLQELFKQGVIKSLHIDSRNTGCLYNKLVFQAMTESSEKYYVVTDNDVFPPLLSPSWLSRMVEIMDRHPELAFLTPQLPPVNLQEPYDVKDDIVYCKAVGNTLKLVRRAAFPPVDQKLYAYGDDGLISLFVQQRGWKIAFCRDIFCWHAGQCDMWGYKPEEIAKDIRKNNYGSPYIYKPVNDLTYEPPQELKV